MPSSADYRSDSYTGGSKSKKSTTTSSSNTKDSPVRAYSSKEYSKKYSSSSSGAKNKPQRKSRNSDWVNDDDDDSPNFSSKYGKTLESSDRTKTHSSRQSSSRRRSSQRSKRKHDENDKCQTNSVMSFLCKLLKYKDCGVQTKCICVKLPDPTVPPPFRKPPQICFMNNPNPCQSSSPKRRCIDPYCCCYDEIDGFGLGHHFPLYPRMPPYCGPQTCGCRCPCPGGSPSPVVIIKDPSASSASSDDNSGGRSIPSYNNCNFYMTPKAQESIGNNNNNGWQKQNNKDCRGKSYAKKSDPCTDTGRSVQYTHRSTSASAKTSTSASASSSSGSKSLYSGTSTWS